MDEMNIEEEAETEEEIGGEWWSWGAGTDGQLGTGRLDDEHLPQRLPDLSSGRRISQLACGGAHVIALSDTGKLFTCGDGSFGQLGHGDYQSHCSPVEVLYFAFKHVEQIACGMRHSLVLLKGSSEDPVYGFGSGKRGQLGVSKDRIRSFAVPQVIFGLGGIKVISISANGDHSAALSANGQLYTWGRGFGGTSDIHLPQTLPSPLRFSQVALGWNHALLLTGEGEVLMLGGNHHGMLSDPQTSRQQHSPVLDSSSVGSAEDSMGLILAKVCGLDGTRVLEIAAGAEHSVLVTVLSLKNRNLKHIDRRLPAGPSQWSHCLERRVEAAMPAGSTLPHHLVHPSSAVHPSTVTQINCT